MFLSYNKLVEKKVMKFVRFGSLKAQKQTHYQEPHSDMWECYPPRKKGFYAFPAGFMDPWFLSLSERRPEDEKNPILQYLHDEEGNKLTMHDIIAGVKLDKNLDDLLIPNEKEKAILQKQKLKSKQLIWVKRPMWVMVYPDTTTDLTYYGLGTKDEDRSRLNQPLDFLLDPSDKKIDARKFFESASEFYHNPKNYEGHYTPPIVGEDIDLEDRSPFGYEPIEIKDDHRPTIGEWLKKKQVRVEQLCVWPCYAEDEEAFAAYLKKARLFEYDGCLWHHLGNFLKQNEILSHFANTWFYTDIYAYERALRKAVGADYAKKRRYQQAVQKVGYGGGAHEHGSECINHNYEVFFDQSIP